MVEDVDGEIWVGEGKFGDELVGERMVDGVPEAVATGDYIFYVFSCWGAATKLLISKGYCCDTHHKWRGLFLL